MVKITKTTNKISKLNTNDIVLKLIYNIKI